VVVLDYGSGNLRSAERALDRVGADVTVTADQDAVAAADGLVVPGVGAFAACMDGIERTGSDRAIRSRLDAGRPVFGICVGLQILFGLGVEHGARRPGLGVFDGTVRQLLAPILPHMGWNTVEPPVGSALFAGVESERFYFVHSFAALEALGAQVTWSTHGERFVAAVEAGPVTGTQFHPEKSADAGAGVLANWVGSLS